MKNLLLIVLLCVCFGCKNTSEEKTKITTYYLIRHAEKDKSDSNNKNPKLIEKGLKRAKTWSKYFEKVDLDVVYSTNYKRTIGTALPTATKKGLKITPYNPKDLDIKSFLEKTKNQTVLIVGHSNSTPAFVNKIINEEKYKSIDETINNKLFIVTISNGISASKIIEVD